MVLLFYSTGMRSVGWVGVIFWPSSYVLDLCVSACVCESMYVNLLPLPATCLVSMSKVR